MDVKPFQITDNHQVNASYPSMYPYNVQWMYLSQAQAVLPCSSGLYAKKMHWHGNSDQKYIMWDWQWHAANINACNLNLEGYVHGYV